jgi:hypothetical protein
MVGHELAIEQFKPTKSKPCNQPCHSNLRRVSFARKHAFPEKCAPHGKPVQPAHKSVSQPAFDAVGMSYLVQATKSRLNVGVNPSVPSVHLRLGASGVYQRKSGICGDDKPVLSDSFGKRL